MMNAPRESASSWATGMELGAYAMRAIVARSAVLGDRARPGMLEASAVEHVVEDLVAGGRGVDDDRARGAVDLVAGHVRPDRPLDVDADLAHRLEAVAPDRGPLVAEHDRDARA